MSNSSLGEKALLMLNVREGLDWLADGQNSGWIYLSIWSLYLQRRICWLFCLHFSIMEVVVLCATTHLFFHFKHRNASHIYKGMHVWKKGQWKQWIMDQACSNTPLKACMACLSFGIVKHLTAFKQPYKRGRFTLYYHRSSHVYMSWVNDSGTLCWRSTQISKPFSK